MVGVNFPVNIKDPSSRVTAYCTDVFKRLDSMVYKAFKANTSNHTIKILLERIKAPRRYNTMSELVKLEARLEKNVQLFNTQLKEDKKPFQAFEQLVTTPDPKQKRPCSGL